MRGAYGLALVGIDGAGPISEALVSAPPSTGTGFASFAPSRTRSRRARSSSSAPKPRASACRAAAWRPSTVETAVATFTTPEPLADDQLVHPMLGYAASAFSGWLGRQVIHAGAVTVDGGAWALLGDRHAGKSTTLASLAHSGCPILVDDVLVLDGRTAFAGPRNIDLAPASVAHLGLAADGPTVRGGYRQRMALGAVEPEVPLRGFVVLSWGERVEVRRVPGSERMARLIGQLHPVPGDADWRAVLDLATLPMLELRRPRRLDSLSDAGRALLAAANDEPHA